jgi:DNA polymerase (family 10)
MLDKFEVARALREIATLLELDGENPFKIRAYVNGARALEELTDDFPALVGAGRLRELDGVGEALAKKIEALHLTGRSELLERLRASHPPGLVALAQIPDVGPKKAAALHTALGVASVAELEAACRDGRVREVKGFGEKTEAKILEGIARMRTRSTRTLLAEALELGERVLVHLRGSAACLRCELGGSTRRARETVNDLDVVAATEDPAALAEHFLRFPLVAETIARGETKTSVRLGSGLQVDLRMVPPGDYATLLHHFTGSRAHHVKLRGRARDRGYTLSEWGLFRLPPRARRGAAAPDAEPQPPPAGSEKVAIESEEALYRTLGLPFIPPELREDEGELEAADAGTLPDDLVRLEDVQGLVHAHTLYSDGRASVEEMARGAEALGMRYLTITDHSGTASYAGGLDEERLKRQWDEIARVQEQVPGVKLLRGTESDILEDGALDWPDRVLERFDVIVASIHSRMKMDEDAMTKRLVRAMSLPVFKIWGHALGRLLNERDPFACRVEEVLDALARSRGAVEVNGDPRRLDMEPKNVRLARARGIPVVLSVDAHSVPALGYLKYAVATARRGWVRRGEVLNTRSAEEFARAVRPAG